MTPYAQQPHATAPGAIDAETVRGDLEHIALFLMRLEYHHPGVVGEHLLQFLDHARTNDVALAMLTAAVQPLPNAPPQPAPQQRTHAR